MGESWGRIDKSGTVRHDLRVEPKLLADLKVLAGEQSLSVNAYIARVLRDHTVTITGRPTEKSHHDRSRY